MDRQTWRSQTAAVDTWRWRVADKVVSEGMLRSATVQEWVFHEVPLRAVTAGQGTGYLVITRGPEDIIYLKTQLRQVTVRSKLGEPRSAFNGLWEVSGATEKFNGLQGADTLRTNRLSETTQIAEHIGSWRIWFLEPSCSAYQVSL
jgi:hypothetical protein